MRPPQQQAGEARLLTALGPRPRLKLADWREEKKKKKGNLMTKELITTVHESQIKVVFCLCKKKKKSLPIPPLQHALKTPQDMKAAGEHTSQKTIICLQTI